MASVLVPLAPGCEELEAVTIVDLLRRAEIDVVTASLDNEPVRCSRGTVLLADISIDDAIGRHFDMIVLPGGLPGAEHLAADPRIHTLLHSVDKSNGYCAAICAAPKVLAISGLLANKNATSFPGVLESLADKQINLVNQPVVQDGNIITSRGPGTAMDFALTLIEILSGKTARCDVEKALQR
ncbi:MAG: DJ-1 family glyoxalase III [Gammaproteobacteria bacterium]